VNDLSALEALARKWQLAIENSTVTGKPCHPESVADCFDDLRKLIAQLKQGQPDAPKRSFTDPRHPCPTCGLYTAGESGTESKPSAPTCWRCGKPYVMGKAGSLMCDCSSTPFDSTAPTQARARLDEFEKVYANWNIDENIRRFETWAKHHRAELEAAVKTPEAAYGRSRSMDKRLQAQGKPREADPKVWK
jgi:hypothetical protein